MENLEYFMFQSRRLDSKPVASRQLLINQGLQSRQGQGSRTTIGTNPSAPTGG
jgi:hypothetical protein